MAIRGKLSSVNRAIALALGVVWLGAGVVGILFGLIHDQMLPIVLALFAIAYAVLWFRVVARSRLLTWRELVVPWRGQQAVKLSGPKPSFNTDGHRRSHMPIDRSFIQMNRTSTNRIRTLVARLNNQELLKPVGKNWTVAITLAHLAFWDRRVMDALDRTEKDGKLFIPEIDLSVNDFSTPLWAAIPPLEAAKIAVETAESLDVRLEKFSAALLEEVYTFNKRLVFRAMHRNEHLDEVDAALEN